MPGGRQLRRNTYDDLAIGVTGEGSTDEGDMPGAVQVLYGSADGLTARGNQLWSQATPGLRTPPYVTFAFGSTLAAGHFAGRKFADLAIGSPDTQVLKDPDPGWSGDDEAGTVNVLYGSADGLSIAGNQLWTQHGRRIKGRVGPDEFGESLVAANFGKDPGRSSYDDLAIGAPLNGPLQEYRGAVHVLFGSPQGLTSVGISAGISGTPASPVSANGLTASARVWRRPTSGVPSPGGDTPTSRSHRPGRRYEVSPTPEGSMCSTAPPTASTLPGCNSGPKRTSEQPSEITATTRTVSVGS